MSKLGVTTLGWLTSILLSLVTLFVFGSLQDYGPESTVRQFHQAAAERDSDTAINLVTLNFDSPPTQELWNVVSNMLVYRKSTFQTSFYQRQDEKAVIIVRYTFPSGERQSLAWVVVRDGKKWVIDTRATALAARNMPNPLGLG